MSQVIWFPLSRNVPHLVPDRELIDDRCPAYMTCLTRFLQIFPDVEYGADIEDWTENVVKLFSAIDLGHQVYMVNESDTPVPINTEAPFDWDIDTAIIGTLPQIDKAIEAGMIPETVILPDSTSARLARRYYEFDIFKNSAGRKLKLAHVPGMDFNMDDISNEHPQAVVPVIHSMLNKDGVSDIRIKIVGKDKYWRVPCLNIIDKNSAHSIEQALVMEFEYAMVHLEGMRDALLVQEDIPMVDEYRIFVVNGNEISTGAACIEFFTPADNEGLIFDTRVEGKRNSGNLRHDPDLVRSYIDFASSIVQEMQEIEPELKNYTIDLARNEETDEIVCIEFNPLLNTGLFAINSDALHKSMLGIGNHESVITESGRTYIKNLKQKIEQDRKAMQIDESLWLDD